MENTYDQASDIWALGCTFLELYSCHESMKISPSQRTPFFMGSSCYPLSPAKSSNEDTSDQKIEELDQVRVIVDNLGKSDELDMSFITNPKGKQYFEFLNKAAPSKSSAPLHILMNLKDTALRDIIKPMLEINPYFRPTAKELLKHSYFDEVRIPEYEHSSKQRLALEIDCDGLKDGETLSSTLTN